jgi:Zn finger protein HypA/HybF involved in hydrogenase expression
MKEKNHTITCKNPNCIGGRIETTMENDNGYSNWTVMDNGFVEFKCHGCGKFGSTDTYKKTNELENFDVTCDNCGSRKWESNIQDVEQEQEKTNIECSDCHAKTYELTS